ncbi:MAG TPA: non-ribosomal peptide synthetase [Legionella sp.]|nr:non-ribosomal peptide synthetase [Legionella sp.]
MAIAAISGEHRVTYDDLNQRANQLAHYLKAIGIKPEQRIALCLQRSVDVLVAMVGILKAGAAYVPLDPSLPVNRLSFIVCDCEAVAILTTSDVAEGLLANDYPIIMLDKTPEISAWPTTPLECEIIPQALAYVIYTSGTTGKPKGVLLEHESVMNYGDWFAAYADTTFQMRIDWSCNYMFDMAVTTTIIPLMLGLTVVICSDATQRDFRQYLGYLKASRIQITKMTPTYFKELLREIKKENTPLPDLQRIILGGEPLRSRDCQRWLQYYPHHLLINEYGPTEATVAFSHYVVDNATSFSTDGNVLIGTPGMNMYYYILDSFRQKVGVGDEGELYIGGAGLARGYLNLPELTNHSFIEDPFCKGARLYKTGDLCRSLPDGTIEYLDRIDRQVKIRGFRVELNEIEQCLLAYPAIEDVAVLVRENEHEDVLLVAYYTAADVTDALTYNEMRQYMLSSLPNYMIPNVFVRLKAFPMAANGKLDYGLLPDHTQPIKHVTDVLSHLERSLIDIWSGELGLSSVGVDDSFWELGGHSLIAARIVSKINQSLDKNMTAQELYQAMTVRELALLIKKTTEEDCFLGKHSEKQQNARLPLSDFQTILWASKTFKPKAAKLNIIARKRLIGTLDLDALHVAFNSVVKKHTILSYRISKYLPIQGSADPKKVSIETIRMDCCSDAEMDAGLRKSMDDLIGCSSWNRRFALLKARLFYLKNDEIELQLSMPHIISDGISMDILFADLSFFYLNVLHNIPGEGEAGEGSPFAAYVADEQLQMQKNIADDRVFWAQYLQDAHLVAFPKHCIRARRGRAPFSYSTYIPIPSKAMHHLEAFCRHQKINFSEALCASIGMSLMHCCGGYQQGNNPVVINVVKSSRDCLAYQKTVGCFLRIESVKLLLHARQTLLLLSQQVHDFFIQNKTSLQGSSMLKLATLNPFYRKKKNVAYFSMKFFTGIFMRWVRVLKINHGALKLCPDLSLLDTKNRFMIYLNIWNNFVNAHQDEQGLFGLKRQSVQMYQYDLLAMDYIFEVCFLRDEHNHKPYVVISSNLDPAFRERIAHEIIRTMNEDMLRGSTTTVPV